MAVKITAPTKVDGLQSFGPHNLLFVGGVCEVPELPWAVESYMREAGYVVERDAEPKPARTRKAQAK